MGDDETRDTTAAALEILAEEGARSGLSSSCPDPAALSGGIEELGISTLKKKFPFLSEYTDSFIMKAGAQNLIKAEKMARQLQDMDRNNKAEDKLFSNREEVDSILYSVAEGKDNRLSQLHPARFLPGAVCSTGKLWLQGREVLHSKGHAPLSSYDLQSIGLGGCVSAKGWVELHDPSSSKLSIKMFAMNSNGFSGKQGKDKEFPDMEDLSELRTAIRVLRGALQMVHPWNHSVNALESFLFQSNFCASDLAGQDKQVNTLVKFIDYVLAENANRWRDKEVFLSTRDIRGVWKDFLCQHSTSPTFKNPKSSNNNNSNKPSFGQQNQGKASQNNAKNFGQGNNSNNQNTPATPSSALNIAPFMFLDDICVMWNIGRCLKPPGSCSDKKGRSLRHVCNFRPDASKPHIKCEKNHPACLFH